MEVAIISPVELLEEYSILSDYQMALAQLVLRNADDGAYAKFFRDRRVAGDYIILDNGTAEGADVPLTKLFEAAKFIKAHEIVLPDVWRSGRATVDAVREALVVRPVGFKYMAVPQGKDSFEWLWCFFEFVRDVRIDSIGIPKNLDVVFEHDSSDNAPAKWYGRVGIVNWLAEMLQWLPFEKPLHLLGIWTDYRELWRYSDAARMLIRSVDTSSPVHCGVEGIEYPPNRLGSSYDEPEEPMDMVAQYHPLSIDERGTIRTNIALLKEAAKGGPGR